VQQAAWPRGVISAALGLRKAVFGAGTGCRLAMARTQSRARALSVI
jgi:hypothetical protein